MTRFRLPAEAEVPVYAGLPLEPCSVISRTPLVSYSVV